ncbi:unnamed protein product [Merluccius merluccius]
MSIIQDKLGNEFLRNSVMDPNFAPGMLMFSHLPPVTSFTRLASQSVMGELPQEMVLKKERDSPPDHPGGQGANGSFLQSMGIKQERLSELDYRMPVYASGAGGCGPGGGGGGKDMLEISFGNHHHNNNNSHQGMLLHDLSMATVPVRPGREPKEPTGRRGRKNGDGQGGKTRRKRGDAKAMLLDADGTCLSPNSKPHICEHCSAAFRSSYHLRRHVLIHTGEKPFCCDQCNMRFIQKYHMERHKRTHSGEKPYRCDTCQQFFSRTDRLLKHKRTCGEAIKKGLDPSMLGLSEAELDQGSYSLTQGNAPASGRKRAKSKNGEGKRKKNAAVSASVGEMGLQNFGMEQPSGSGPQGRTPKLMFKKAGRKSADKGDGQKLLSQKPGAMEQHAGGSGLDAMGVAKQGPATTSSNYDDAMQFVKKRRYLQAANNDYGTAGGLHMASQAGVLQSSLGPEPTLAMLDTSPLELKHDKSGIPDEVLQSLLEHYSHKADGTQQHHHHHHQHHHHHHQHHHHDVNFDLSDHPHHVDLQPAAPVTPELEEEESGAGDKTVVMSEYSKFLLQALERTSHSGPFPSLGPSGPFPTPFPLLGSSSSPTGPLFSEKHVYSTSPLECVYPPAISSPLPIADQPSSAATAAASSSKTGHYGMLVGSPAQPAFHLGLESSGLGQQQQLTPSQELTEQLEKQHSPKGDQGPKAGAGGSGGGGTATATNGSGYPDLSAALDVPKEATYQIENFAQAFGSQFKSGRHTPLGGYSGGGGGRATPAARWTTGYGRRSQNSQGIPVCWPTSASR